MSKKGLFRFLGSAAAGLLFHSNLLFAAVSATDPNLPRIVSKEGHYALLVDGNPYLMLGVQINNSSAWPDMLPKVWPVIESLHANTVEAPIYWEQFEPQEGKFDPLLVDLLVQQAREHHVHLVLLWFGTWKNSSPHYTPEWVKQNEAKYPRVLDAKGKKMDSLSPHFSATLEADKRAFAALMRHLKEIDPQHTVLMVQVENEAGTYGTARDFSPAAQKLFGGAVPAALLKSLDKKPGPWTEVFGKDADEFFHAWSVASYINQVAAAGKEIYPLPMSVNVALRDPIQPPPPGAYESGGPTDNVLSLWKTAAPSIDVIGPDIYFRDYAKFLKVLDLYSRPDNAMFVPELGNDTEYARYFFATLGHGGIGFSPFGMDETGYANYPLGARKVTKETLEPFARNYALLGPMQREIAKLNYEGKVHGFSEDPSQHQQTLTLGGWKVTVSYGTLQFGPDDHPKGNPEPKGGVLLAQLGLDEFLVSGYFARVDFSVADAANKKERQYLRVEEGNYDNGQWRPSRIWNGDQTDFGLNFTELPQVLRVKLAVY